VGKPVDADGLVAAITATLAEAEEGADNDELSRPSGR
jgi:hypothetical protein